MSCTVIYKFKKNGDADFIGETHNAFRGAMQVWTLLEKKYLPKYTPSWAFGDKSQEYSRMSCFDKSGMKDIWGLAEDTRLSEHERIVLNSTFDNVIVFKDEVFKLLAAFRAFEGETSLKEQADIIEDAINTDEDLIAIAWNQTSVNSDTWESDEIGLDEDGEEIYLPYNVFKHTGHWSLFESK